MKDFAPEDYLELKDFIVSEILNKSPAQFDRLVRNQMKIEKGLSYDGAVDEVIANACQTMLLNSKAVTKLARQNMDLAEKIRDYIGETAEKFKAAFEEVDVNDDISLYEAVRAISDVYDNVLKLWDKALLAANENYNAEQATGKKNTAENGGVQNMYFGEQAREADMTALETARSMEENGTDAETIRKDTGWFRGMDGKWRVEIDDSRIKWESAGDIQFRRDYPEYDEYRNLLDKMCNSPEMLTEDEQKRLVELDDMWSGELSRLSQRVKNGRVKLGNVLRHESLFRNYPELKDILVEYADLGPTSGRLLPMTGDGNAVIQINRNLKSDPRSTLVHEIQHAIQYIEGFTTGSSPTAWETKGWQRYEQAQRYVDAVERERESLFDNDPFFEELDRKAAEGKITDSEYMAQAEAHMKENTEYERLTLELNRAIARAAAYKRNRNAAELYRNTAGEIEARDVQYRQRYDAEKRRNTPPDLGDENTVFADVEDAQIQQFQKVFNEQVDKVKTNTHDKNNHLNMGTTPVRLTRILSLPKIPMLITGKHVYSMAVSKQTAIKEKRYDPHFHYHDLGWDAVKKLPKEINKPAMLIKSIKDPTDARFVVVTNMVDRVGRPVIVPVKPAGNGQYFNLDFTENAALSGYGRTGFNSFVQTAKNENRILYVYKKSNQTSKNTRGVQFTNDILAADYSKNLSQFKQLVKTKFTGTLFENGYDSDGNLIQFQKWGIGETAEERTVSKERFDRLRAEKNAKIEEVRKAEVEKRREAVKKEKAEKWRKVEKTKDYYRDMMKRQRSKRADTAMRGKIKAYRRAA